MLKRFVFIIISVLAGILFALLLAEGILQIYNPFKPRVRFNRIVLARNTVERFENNRIAGLDPVITIRRNGLGFRGPDRPVNFTACRTILTVGGSTTECRYLSEGDTWPDHLRTCLQKGLQAGADSIWVNNAGLDGHSTFGHLILMNDYLLELRPDLVLMMVGLNEIGRSDLVDQEFENVKKGLQLHSVEGFFKSLGNYSEIVSIVLNLYRYERAKSKGVTHRTFDLRSLNTIEEPPQVIAAVLEKHRRRFLQPYEQRLRKLIELAQGHGIELVLITQPALYGDVRDDVTGVDLRSANFNGKSGHLNCAILQLYNQVTARVGLATGSLVIDLAEKMPKSSRLYYDTVHFSKQGARAVAAIVCADLQAHWQAGEKP